MVSGTHLTSKHLTTICSFTGFGGERDFMHVGNAHGAGAIGCREIPVFVGAHLWLEWVVRCLSGITVVEGNIWVRWMDV